MKYANPNQWILDQPRIKQNSKPKEMIFPTLELKRDDEVPIISKKKNQPLDVSMFCTRAEIQSNDYIDFSFLFIYFEGMIGVFL